MTAYRDGKEAETAFSGESHASGPDGVVVLVSVDRDDDVLVAPIDMALVAEVRRRGTNGFVEVGREDRDASDAFTGAREESTSRPLRVVLPVGALSPLPDARPTANVPFLAPAQILGQKSCRR